ncbi:N-acetyltransferase [Gordonia sp. CPCC 206044]|uniref:GNAT family N-acetyltransferase n=1 Tax=Gordonia sp. CPCC 206044 TaxID=3140793 RepID=UPI003AF3A256
MIELITDLGHAPDVAEVAAATFPLACPPHSTPEDIAGFIRDNLAPSNFARYILRAESDVLVARDVVGGPIIGYCLVKHDAPTHPDVAAVITDRPVSEVSKMYVVPDHHARGRSVAPSRALMDAAIECARANASVVVWLGVNQENERAQRFYTKMGFARVGVKTFDLNGSVEHDYVFAQRLD